MTVLTTQPVGGNHVTAAGTAPAGTARPTLGESVPEPLCFSLATLLDDLRRHPELDLDTLTYHLTQSDATAADGYCHAAINEARSFLEALLVSILGAVRPDPPDKSRNNGSHHGMPFRCYRRSLLECGFIDGDENDLLQYVYSVASAKGSHHGVTDEAWARLARRMVFTTGQYVIQHYGAWKRNGCCAVAGDNGVHGSSPAYQPSPNNSWRTWLARVVLRVPAGQAD